jgi:hypothetical protein
MSLRRQPRSQGLVLPQVQRKSPLAISRKRRRREMHPRPMLRKSFLNMIVASNMAASGCTMSALTRHSRTLARTGTACRLPSGNRSWHWCGLLSGSEGTENPTCVVIAASMAWGFWSNVDIRIKVEINLGATSRLLNFRPMSRKFFDKRRPGEAFSGVSWPKNSGFSVGRVQDSLSIRSSEYN